MSERRKLLKILGGGAALFNSGLLAAADSAAPAADEIQRILASSDQIRNPPNAFGTEIRVTEYRNRRVAEQGRIRVLAQPDSRIGQYDSLVRIIEPRRDNGKMMLKTAEGNEIWFYDPASKSGMRISLQQRLLGQAANGDVVSVNLAGAYRGKPPVREKILDGERRERECWRLDLYDGSPAVTYPSMQYWVEVGSSQPVKAQFHADSGRLLKTAYYRRYQERLGASRPTEVVILDGINKNMVTVLRYSNYESVNVPRSWFTREGLPAIPANA